MKNPYFVLSIVLLVLIFCSAWYVQGGSPTTPFFNTPSEYFLRRELTNKRIPSASKRNPLSQPYKQKAETRYTSKGGWNSRLTKTTPASKTEMYDATLMYDTYDLDLHPYVLDVGCIQNGLYIRPEGSEESINALTQQLSAGNLLVSRKTTFVCHDHSLNDQAETAEKVLYRLITKSQFIYNKENGISYFEIQTKKLSFLQLFSKIKLFMTKPVYPSRSGTRYVGEKKDEKAFQTGWNVKKDSKGNTIYSGGVPQVDVAKYTQSISIFTIECQNCYFNFYAGYYIYVETDLPWDLIDTVKAHGAYEVRVIFPSLKVTTSGKIEKEFEVLPKKNLYTFVFAVGPVPVELSVGVGVKFKVELEATSTVTFSADYIRSGTAGFKYVEGDYEKVVKSTSNSGGFKVKDYSLVEASAKFQVKPTLYVTFYEMIPIIVQINPYILAKISKNSKAGCKLGLDTYWGIDCTIGVDEIEFKGYTIWDGYTWDFKLYGEEKISALSGLCVKKSRRALDENLLIGSVEQLEEMKSTEEYINDGSTLVTRKITLQTYDETFFDVIRLDLTFTVSCRIAYGSVSFDLSSSSTDIVISDVIAHGVNEITVSISKEASEAVVLNYYKIKTSLSFGQVSTVRAGLLSFEEPPVIPEYIEIKTSTGTLRYNSSSAVIPSLIRTSSITFPLLLKYEGADSNIVAYPIYTSASGDRLSHVVTPQSKKFAVKYTTNTGLSPFVFEDLIITFSTASKEVYGVKLVTGSGSSFDSTMLNIMTGFQTLDVNSENSLSSVPTYLYFEVTGTFSSAFELEFEILECYAHSLTKDFSLTYTTQSAFALRLYRSASFADDGLVIEFDNKTRGFVSYVTPTEFKKLDSVYASTASRKNIFGISRQYHEGLLETHINLRVEPRHPKVIFNPLASTISVIFEGSISFSSLKHENLTIDIAFVNNGKDTSHIDYSLLRKEHNIYMAINIEDPQYTFNSYSIANINTFVKFILSIKCSEIQEEDSDWNQLILPLLVNEVVSGAKGLVVLESPQRMLIKLPIVHNLEKKVERVFFTTVSPHLFSPQPLNAFGVGEIDLVGHDLTPGDIGSVIASVVGFSIIGVLVLVLVSVIVYLVVTKRKQNQPADVVNTTTSDNAVITPVVEETQPVEMVKTPVPITHEEPVVETSPAVQEIVEPSTETSPTEEEQSTAVVAESADSQV